MTRSAWRRLASRCTWEELCHEIDMALVESAALRAMWQEDQERRDTERLLTGDVIMREGEPLPLVGAGR